MDDELAVPKDWWTQGEWFAYLGALGRAGNAKLDILNQQLQEIKMAVDTLEQQLTTTYATLTGLITQIIAVAQTALTAAANAADDQAAVQAIVAQAQADIARIQAAIPPSPAAPAVK